MHSAAYLACSFAGYFFTTTHESHHSQTDPARYQPGATMNVSYVDTKDLHGEKFLDFAQEPVP
jgi:hypothetical protein